MGYEFVNRIQMAWWDLLDTVIKNLVLQKAEEFLSS
jgi:hypothetical protein